MDDNRLEARLERMEYMLRALCGAQAVPASPVEREVAEEKAAKAAIAFNERRERDLEEKRKQELEMTQDEIELREFMEP